jgi:protein phosphatase 1B
MTRVLGDFGLNKAFVPPMADIIEYPRDGSASFLLLACERIWDVMSNEEVARFVTQRVSTIPLETIISALLDECFRKESSDNMSVYLVRL